MAELHNNQRKLGVRVVSDGATMHNNQPVIGVRPAEEGDLFSDNQRTLGVEVIDAGAIWNEQPVRGVVVINDARRFYNSSAIVPVWGLEAVEVPRAEVEMLSEVSFDGVTFTFNKPAAVCRSCLGEIWVQADAGLEWTASSHPSALVGEHMTNGAMIDPNVDEGQGFDGLLGTGAAATINPYVAEMNVDPAASGPLALDRPMSIVKSIRIASPTTWQTIEKYIVLTVGEDLPPEGFFRPGMVATDKSIPDHWREAAADYGILRSLPQPSGAITSKADAEARIILTSPYFMCANGEKRRRLDVEESGPAASNYSRDYALTRSDALHWLHSNVSNADKRVAFLRSIQKGIDLAHMVDAGYDGFGGAGQSYGRQEFPYLAAFALKDTGLLTKAQYLLGGTFDQTRWVYAPQIGYPVLYPSGTGTLSFNHITYLDSDLHIPEWSTNSRAEGPMPDDNASWWARYRDMYVSGMMGALAIALLRNGPGGISGEEAALRGPMGPGNDMASWLAYYDRAAPWPYNFRPTGQFNIVGRSALWNERRDLLATPKWTGRPEALERSTGSQVTAGAGSISYDWSEHTFSTLPITRYDRRYSVDPDDGYGAVQWVQQDSVPNVGTITGLSYGIPHEVSIRAVNAAGAGRWSPTYPLTGPLGANPARRNRVTPTGSGDAAPVSLVAPVLHARRYPAWGGEEYFPVTEIVDGFPNELIAGVGYYSGSPAPTLSWQWLRDGVAISGATDRRYVLTSLDAGKEIKARLTLTNASGSVSVDSNAIDVPSGEDVEWTRVTNGVAAYVGRSGQLDNIVDSSQFTLAMRYKLNAGDGTARQLFRFGTGSISRMILQATTTNKLQLQLQSAAPAVLFNATTAANAGAAGTWFTFVASADLTAGVAHVYLNGVAEAAPSVLTAGVLDLANTQGLYLLASSTGGGLANADVEYAYLSSIYVDLSNPANLAKFSDPALMLPDGAGPTGTRPEVYLYGGASEWNDGLANKGSGGAFSKLGTGSFAAV